jgi:hypothetical protein
MKLLSGHNVVGAGGAVSGAAQSLEVLQVKPSSVDFDENPTPVTLTYGDVRDGDLVIFAYVAIHNNSFVETTLPNSSSLLLGGSLSSTSGLTIAYAPLVQGQTVVNSPVFPQGSRTLRSIMCVLRGPKALSLISIANTYSDVSDGGLKDQLILILGGPAARPAEYEPLVENVFNLSLFLRRATGIAGNQTTTGGEYPISREIKAWLR